MPTRRTRRNSAASCAAQLEREIVFQGPDTVAAFIAEPIQGAGGVIVPPANFWPLVREVCDRHGVLLIADEVVTGFGRGGAMFGTRLWDVKADLWCLAKGISSGYIPLGATAISAKVAEVFDSDATGAGAGGTRLHLQRAPGGRRRGAGDADRSCRPRTCPATWRAWRRPSSSGCAAWSSACPFVGNVRGKGLMLGIEMVADQATKTPLPKSSDIPARVAKAAYRRGLMVRVSGAQPDPVAAAGHQRSGARPAVRHAGSRLRRGGGRPMNTVLLVGTADTKSDEIAFLREQVQALGAPVLVMDVGVLAAGHAPVDIANTEVAAAAGSTLQQVIDSGDENTAMTRMAQGAARHRRAAAGARPHPRPAGAGRQHGHRPGLRRGRGAADRRAEGRASAPSPIRT